MAAFSKTSVSKTWTFFDGDWHEGNVAIMGARTHAAWLGSMVFDGARAYEGVAPDLALHCARVNDSATHFHLKPLVSVDDWLGLVADGRRRFAPDAELYIRPMYWAEAAGPAACATIRNRRAGACASTRRRSRSRSAAPSRCRRSVGRRRNAPRSAPRQAASTPTIRAP